MSPVSKGVIIASIAFPSKLMDGDDAKNNKHHDSCNKTLLVRSFLVAWNAQIEKDGHVIYCEALQCADNEDEFAVIHQTSLAEELEKPSFTAQLS